MLEKHRGGEQNSSGTVLSTDCGVVRKIFRDVAVLVLGGEPGQYGLHSLRTGAATDALNVQPSLVARMGLRVYTSKAIGSTTTCRL